MDTNGPAVPIFKRGVGFGVPMPNYRNIAMSIVQSNRIFSATAVGI